ncbi:hypothetical protein KI387_031223, partial [Taxus chinensis]
VYSPFLRMEKHEISGNGVGGEAGVHAQSKIMKTCSNEYTRSEECVYGLHVG